MTQKNIHPLLARYLASLAARPIYTKAVTSGALLFIQEIVANHIAGVQLRSGKASPIYTRALSAAKIDLRAFKLAIYGFLVGAPLSHALVGALQKAFEGNGSPLSKILFLLANNFLVAPVQTAVYLASVAVIDGAKTPSAIVRVIRAGILKVLRVTWVASPLAVLIAQKYIPTEYWVIWYNLVSFTLGLAANVVAKAAKQKALAGKEKAREAKDEKDSDAGRD